MKMNGSLLNKQEQTEAVEVREEGARASGEVHVVALSETISVIIATRQVIGKSNFHSSNYSLL